jgi:hypothetical protein
MVTKRTGRPPGRPKRKDFLEDPDRHQLALIDATMAVYGLEFEPAARLALCTESKPVEVSSPKLGLKRAGRRALEAGWHLQSFERIKPGQAADSRIDTLRSTRNRLAGDERAQAWLYNMRNAWMVILQRGPGAARIVAAFAAEAGETQYADEFMLPFLRSMANE